MPNEHPIFSAVKKGDTDAILEAKIDNLNLENSSGISPLAMAAFYGNPKVIAMLCKLGASVNKVVWHNGESPVYMAAEQGHAPAITALYKAGANLNKKNNNDKAPLHIATENGHFAAVKALLEAGADASIRYWFIWTAIDWAKENKKDDHSKIAALLEAHLTKYPTGVKMPNLESTPLCLSTHATYRSEGTELSSLSRSPKSKVKHS